VDGLALGQDVLERLLLEPDHHGVLSALRIHSQLAVLHADLDLVPRLKRAADRQVSTHLRKLEKEGRVKVYAGKPRQKSPQELAQAEEEEHERIEILRRADEIRDEARRRALISQENPSTGEWEDPPRYALA
jgi:hypothetical protein